jgi:putative alpha-1,2-mannosidase
MTEYKICKSIYGNIWRQRAVKSGATVPFGMIAVGPDSNPRTHAGYDYAIDKISGVSINRLSGVGCSGCGGNLSVRTSAPDQELHIIKSTEKATPGYYEVTFNNGVKGSFTATNNMAVQQYDFGKDADRSIWINFASSFEGMVDCEFKLKSNHEIIGIYKHGILVVTECINSIFTCHPMNLFRLQRERIKVMKQNFVLRKVKIL